MAILGIDEVGRGPWAGPLVVGACVLDFTQPIAGLADSKTLSGKRRRVLAQEIRTKANFGLGWVSAAKLDEIGLSAALCLATRNAVRQIKTPYHEIIIDGTANFLTDTPLSEYVEVLKKADALVPAVSAASIIAKVARDEYMINLAQQYPEYGFEKHVGYGTAAHRLALTKFGPCPEHRRSFRPVAAFFTQPSQPLSQTTTKAKGDHAEQTVADFLLSNNHTIVARNWRTKYCEIDIISQKNQTLYFTEVKYRKNSQKITGQDAVDSKKLRQMHFAAKYYLSNTNQSFSARLAVADVFGENYILKGWKVLP